MNKQELRNKMRSVLKNIKDKEEKSTDIQNQIINSKQYLESKKVLLYYSLPQEVTTHKLIEDALNKGKEVYLPFSDKIAIGRINSTKELVIDKLGIKVPTSKADSSIFDELDLVIVPGVAFDNNGNRLGKGSGWYDKLIEKLNSEVTIIGIAFSEQIVDSVPHLKHDKKVNLIIWG